eukprot:c6114_g1_i3.p1 GENE.c6114_g1_i3~~c6114_g1_i3.p1  ORF type:complete len:201 (+),score=52.24 c6114_g1_i3:524-1126(+)
MHKNQICHHDLKPENLLCSSDVDLVVKISDFGLAEHLKHFDKSSKRAGTPYYIAPEILKQGETPNLGTASDLWSLGVVLYTLLCGYPPFYDDDLPNLFALITAGKFEFDEENWSGCSEAAKDLIRRLLVVDPRFRLTANEVLEHPWITCADLSTEHMQRSFENFKQYNAKRRFRRVGTAIKSLQRLVVLGQLRRTSQTQE